MSILIKIGTMFIVIGIVAILGPFVGIGLKNLNAEDTRIAGGLLAGLGTLFLLLGYGATKLQESLDKRRAVKNLPQRKVPDDIIK